MRHLINVKCAYNIRRFRLIGSLTIERQWARQIRLLHYDLDVQLFYWWMTYFTSLSYLIRHHPRKRIVWWITKILTLIYERLDVRNVRSTNENSIVLYSYDDDDDETIYRLLYSTNVHHRHRFVSNWDVFITLHCILGSISMPTELWIHLFVDHHHHKCLQTVSLTVLD